MNMKMANGKNQILLKSWEQGVEQFNSGMYWHAHERWEIGWENLESPEKQYVQALIQICGVFYLLVEKSRMRPAFSLARSALLKLERSSQEGVLQVFPRIEIQGDIDILKEIISFEPQVEVLTPTQAKEYASRLNARVLYSFGVEP